jgi:hypothetical protein
MLMPYKNLTYAIKQYWHVKSPETATTTTNSTTSLNQIPRHKWTKSGQTENPYTFKEYWHLKTTEIATTTTGSTTSLSQIPRHKWTNWESLHNQRILTSEDHRPLPQPRTVPHRSTKSPVTSGQTENPRFTVSSPCQQVTAVRSTKIKL